MSLASKAKEIRPRNILIGCGIARIMDRLTPTDLEWLQEQLLSEHTASWIGDVLRADGHDVSDLTVRRHRTGKCSCP